MTAIFSTGRDVKLLNGMEDSDSDRSLTQKEIEGRYRGRDLTPLTATSGGKKTKEANMVTVHTHTHTQKERESHTHTQKERESHTHTEREREYILEVP